MPRAKTLEAFVSIAGAALAGWVAAGSERISYAGLQIALAFFVCIFQGFAPDTRFDIIRNRVFSIVLGILVTSIVFHYLWPEHEAEKRIRAEGGPGNSTAESSGHACTCNVAHAAPAAKSPA